MTTGYSKLILDEYILPNRDAPLIASDFEQQMTVLRFGHGTIGTTMEGAHQRCRVEDCWFLREEGIIRRRLIEKEYSLLKRVHRRQYDCI